MKLIVLHYSRYVLFHYPAAAIISVDPLRFRWLRALLSRLIKLMFDVRGIY